MAQQGDFLGLSHDVCSALSQGIVKFGPRARIFEKVEIMLAEATANNCLDSRQASKLYGILNFFERGVYGKVGAGSLWAIKERQYDNTTTLTQDLLDNFRCVRAIVRQTGAHVAGAVVAVTVASSWCGPVPRRLCREDSSVVVPGLAASRGARRTSRDIRYPCWLMRC